MLIYKKFNSVKDFYNSGTMRDHTRLRVSSCDFCGINTYSDIKTRLYSWETGIKDIDLSQPLSIGKYKRVYSYDDGDDMNYERYKDEPELPFMIKRVKDTDNTGNGKYAVINVNLTESACIDAKILLNKTRAVLSIVDALESQDIRCKVNAFFCTTHTFRDRNDFFIKITIKNFEDALNVGLMSTCLSPWFMRYHVFNYLYNHYNNCSDGLGGMVPMSYFTKEIKKIDRDYNPSDYNITIERGECLNKSGIDNKVKQINRMITN